MENILRDRRVYELLEEVDRDLALKAQAEGCEHCGGALHRGDYPRKPRGGPGWEKRYSFCCSREDCRKRRTPASVRFLGRKVYVGVVVVLVSAMMQGLSGGRVKRLRQALRIDRRTLLHWRKWWMRTFVRGAFWRAERGRFRRPIVEEKMALGLVSVFGAAKSEGLVSLMRFLSPITTSSCKGVMVM
ncbi:MAG: hypothetical protein AB1512_25280 [Thermodesulfobacteriota bacterium]